MAKERVQRRLAATLVADVVGHSRLVEADEEATVSTLGTYREIIEGLVISHRGRVFGAAGDSVIAEFAEAVLFLLSDPAGYITSEVIRVGDGR